MSKGNRGGGLGLLVAFLGGAIAGGVLTWLLAPAAEPRRRLLERLSAQRDSATRISGAARVARNAAVAAFADAMKGGKSDDPDSAS